MFLQPKAMLVKLVRQGGAGQGGAPIGPMHPVGPGAPRAVATLRTVLHAGATCAWGGALVQGGGERVCVCKECLCAQGWVCSV